LTEYSFYIRLIVLIIIFNNNFTFRFKILIDLKEVVAGNQSGQLVAKIEGKISFIGNICLNAFHTLKEAKVDMVTGVKDHHGCTDNISGG